MNFISAIRQNIKLQEGSTKRGISCVITGAVTLYMVFKGQPVDFDSILQLVFSKVEFWIGIGLNVTGLLGMFIPDEPKTVHIELPKIELIGQAGNADPDRADAVRGVVTEQLRQSVPPQPDARTGEKWPDSGNGNGGGWNG